MFFGAIINKNNKIISFHLYHTMNKRKKIVHLFFSLLSVVTPSPCLRLWIFCIELQVACSQFYQMISQLYIATISMKRHLNSVFTLKFNQFNQFMQYKYRCSVNLITIFASPTMKCLWNEPVSFIILSSSVRNVTGLALSTIPVLYNICGRFKALHICCNENAIK